MVLELVVWGVYLGQFSERTWLVQTYLTRSCY